MSAALAHERGLESVIAVRARQIRQRVMDQSLALAVADRGIQRHFGPRGDVLAVRAVRFEELWCGKGEGGREVFLYGDDVAEGSVGLSGQVEFGDGEGASPAGGYG